MVIEEKARLDELALVQDTTTKAIAQGCKILQECEGILKKFSDNKENGAPPSASPSSSMPPSLLSSPSASSPSPYNNASLAMNLFLCKRDVEDQINRLSQSTEHSASEMKRLKALGGVMLALNGASSEGDVNLIKMSVSRLGAIVKVPQVGVIFLSPLSPSHTCMRTRSYFCVVICVVLMLDQIRLKMKKMWMHGWMLWNLQYPQVIWRESWSC